MTMKSTKPPAELKTRLEKTWLKKAEHTAWRKLAGETVVLDLQEHRMFGFNEAAAALWSALIEHPVPRHDQGPETADFLDRLSELGLVQIHEPVTEPGSETADFHLSEIPQILWQEKLEQAAATCAFLPGQNVLCGQVPFS